MPFGTDREVLATARAWLAAGQRAALVTVCRTWGSSPRPPGSLLVMRADGACAGSVSGGCIEEDLLARYRDGELALAGPTLLDYGVDRADAGRVGLPCGGRLELLVEPLGDLAALEQLLSHIDAGELVARHVELSTGTVALRPVAATQTFLYADGRVEKVFGPAWHLLLIGDGQIARLLAQMAGLLDFRVSICDPRATAFHDPLPGNVQLIRLMPDEAALTLADDPRSAVVALAHDPRIDDMALMVALESQAFYVGAMGSRRSSDQRRARLRALGLAPSALARLRAPVGLAIGSHTPAEIALSILAEVVATRNSDPVATARPPARVLA